MSFDPVTRQPELQQHINTFLQSFIVNGTRNYLRKTTKDASWMNIGVMERTNTEAFYSSRLFAGLNIVGGGGYSLGHGFIHGHLKDAEDSQLGRSISNLNSLGAKEIIFYHDESARGLEKAREMGFELKFKPVTFLDWLIREVKSSPLVRPLEADVAVQLPCSWRPGDGTNKRLGELFDLIGIRRVGRKKDFKNRVCCGVRGYFGLITGHTEKDSTRADAGVAMNVEDAKQAGASHMVTTCPYCYAALASSTKNAGMIPVQVESLVSQAIHGEPLPGGLAFM